MLLILCRRDRRRGRRCGRRCGRRRWGLRPGSGTVPHVRIVRAGLLAQIAIREEDTVRSASQSGGRKADTRLRGGDGHECAQKDGQQGSNGEFHCDNFEYNQLQIKYDTEYKSITDHAFYSNRVLFVIRNVFHFVWEKQINEICIVNTRRVIISHLQGAITVQNNIQNSFFFFFFCLSVPLR